MKEKIIVWLQVKFCCEISEWNLIKGRGMVLVVHQLIISSRCFVSSTHRHVCICGSLLCVTEIPDVYSLAR